ncbi:FAD-binding oxidoreductase [Devosia algicola]|uniref:FAD-binding oxidoreductase n=1 Tax=Devosia algicola TaxID=3026418 RepID=A0ABY7YLK1_9HYPH|nr:FAD-binding oxidoreductase [Devosia algicola]WDR02067.1 FAD-binding oxidoreductase [Devosia algicola]
MANSQSYAGNGAYPPSYYAASKTIDRKPVKLEGDVEADICVVGAGYSGLSSALHLAEHGYKVVVVEGAAVGWGASGRNGGQVVNGLNASLGTIESRYGADTAKFVGSLVQEGAGIINDWVERYKIDCDLRRGNIYAAYTPKHVSELEAKQALWRRYGMDDHEMLDAKSIRSHIGSDVYCGGMIDHSGGHMHPLNLALGEAAALEGLGGVIFEHSPVTKVNQTASGAEVLTANGKVSAKAVLVCGNAYLGNVVPELTARVMPVSTQMMATEPLGADRAQQLLPTGMCVEDVRYILDYFRLSGDNRLIFGGGVVYGGTDPADVIAKLRPNMDKVFPQLGDIKIDYAWSGNFALSFSRVPQLGRLGDNVYFAHGYSGHGITGSHLFGRILAEAVNGDLTRFDTFASLPWIPFPGGRRFRAQYSTLGSWWYAFKDRMGL